MQIPKTFPINLYFGPPGSGKSYRMRQDFVAFIDRMRQGKEYPGIIVSFDQFDEFKGLKHYTLTEQDFWDLDYTDYPMGTTFVWSDCHLLIPSKDRFTNPLITLLSYGRHRGFRIFADSQRPANVHTSLSGYATDVKVFNTASVNDLKYYQNQFGANQSDITSLGKYEFWNWKR